MKKLISFCILYSVTVLAFANSCPSTNEFLVERNGGHEVIAPPGWKVTFNNKKLHTSQLRFRVAAWGDHKHPSDNIRCYYYLDGSAEQVTLESLGFIDESRMLASPAFGVNDHYGLCVTQTGDVASCQYN